MERRQDGIHSRPRSATAKSPSETKTHVGKPEWRGRSASKSAGLGGGGDRRFFEIPAHTGGCDPGAGRAEAIPGLGGAAPRECFRRSRLFFGRRLPDTLVSCLAARIRG